MSNIKPQETRRSQSITMRLTIEEVTLLDDEAERRQCTRTDIVRGLIDDSTFAKDARDEG